MGMEWETPKPWSCCLFAEAITLLAGDGEPAAPRGHLNKQKSRIPLQRMASLRVSDTLRREARVSPTPGLSVHIRSGLPPVGLHPGKTKNAVRTHPTFQNVHLF